MSNLPLRDLPWEPVKYAGGAANDAQGAGIYYRAIQRDGKHIVYWVDSMGGSDGDKSFDSWDELKDWVETTHYPHKMQPYVVPSQTWISVKDRLPEEDGLYFAFYPGSIHERQVISFSSNIKRFNLFHDAVTHWMPLPNLPTGE